jgi:hypothetical protein
LAFFVLGSKRGAQLVTAMAVEITKVLRANPEIAIALAKLPSITRRVS